jgi:hypothetical protein
MVSDPFKQARLARTTRPASATGAPAVRCRHLRTTLAAMAGLPEVDLVLADLPAEARDAVTRAAGSDWLPVRFDLMLARAICLRLGGERARALAHEVAIRAVAGPLLRTVAEAAQRVMAPHDAMTLFRWLPKGWALLFRDVGRWEVEPLICDRLLARLCDLPACCLEEPAWLDAVEGALSAVLTLGRVDGTVSRLEVDGAARSVIYVVRWTRPSPPP